MVSVGLGAWSQALLWTSLSLLCSVRSVHFLLLEIGTFWVAKLPGSLDKGFWTVQLLCLQMHGAQKLLRVRPAQTVSDSIRVPVTIPQVSEEGCVNSHGCSDLRAPK